MAKDKLKGAATSRTFVLVHGAWHGGWCWTRVAERLSRAGARVFAPTLTGLADRSHLLGQAISLDTHVADLVNLFLWNDVEDAVLVGHSYGGWPISAAAERLEDRIRSIVFLDAFLPKAGQKGLDLNSAASRADLLEALAQGRPSRPPPPVSSFKIKSADDERWIESKLTGQPIGVSLQPIVLTGARERIKQKTYIRTPHYPNAEFDRAYEACKGAWDWRTFEISDSGHDAMIDQPKRLAELLLACA